ncbi:hypothetical protein COB72_02705 [bacterium]|nr:MAG: hypothetical protein COB72_02705 [bacterium]
MHNRGGSRDAFTMIDLLVTIAVISLLIGLLLPGVAKVRESTRKIVCGSNMRQMGMGVSMFTQDNMERLPNSVFLLPPRSNAASYPSPERMDTVRLTYDEYPNHRGDLWDGLGLLFAQEYITAPNVYYCPSHTGNFIFEDGEEAWVRLDGEDEIIINYHYRGAGPDDSRVLYNINPTAALVTDTLRSYNDLNHEGGFNILQAGLAVNWFEDIGDEIAQDILLRSGEDGNQASTVINAWDLLDGDPNDNDLP